MLNRTQVLSRLKYYPKFIQEGKFSPNLERFINANAYPSTKLEARICLVEEALVNWYRVDPVRFMGQFMQNLDFDWEDVRNLGRADDSLPADVFRHALLRNYAVTTSSSDHELWDAMRLVDKWFRINAGQNADGGEPEFNFVAAALAEYFPPNSRRSVILCFVSNYKSRSLIAQSAISGLLLSTFAAYWASRPTLYLACMAFSSLMFFSAAILAFGILWVTPRCTRYILALTAPRRT